MGGSLLTRKIVPDRRRQVRGPNKHTVEVRFEFIKSKPTRRNSNKVGTEEIVSQSLPLSF